MSNAKRSPRLSEAQLAPCPLCGLQTRVEYRGTMRAIFNADGSAHNCEQEISHRAYLKRRARKQAQEAVQLALDV